ncbi:uncharacterized protein LOC130450423 [Diorhabda sublineata]|uniref:uncharacterized protein LOC130450423 n=1 Tax=Diorhabda sublineata TaxID=1163346 RepID=UPI0024E042FA|nr:uncharacterized protein LOC130450423 [Diorhabda sublineata]
METTYGDDESYDGEENTNNLSDREHTEEDISQQSKDMNDNKLNLIPFHPLNNPSQDNVQQNIISNFNKHTFVSGDRSFSFHNFNGPISKEVRQVVVPNTNPRQPGAQSIDFVGKPDYSFAYGVHDDQIKNSHTHMESRDGDALRGEYRVLQPDGLVRIVRYVADPVAGFQMTVAYAKF